MPNKIKIEAKEVSQAITKGLKKLGLRRDQVEVSVLQQPKKGFLGIGAKDAIVELRPKRWSSADLDAQIYMDIPKRKGGKGRNGRNGGRRYARRRTEDLEVRIPRAERAPKENEPQQLPSEEIRNAVIPENLKAPMQEAKEHLEQVLTHMGVKVENLNVWWDEKQQRILLTFDCDHPAIVIGKEGKTLEAIQYLSTLALSRHFDKPISVITDTQNYWRKAEDKLNAEIERGIELIKSGHSVFRFRPMPAQLRRYIHRALEGNEYVTTASEGEGKWRKVTFRPTEKVAELLNTRKAPADFVPGVIGEDKPEETTATPSSETQVCAEVTVNAVMETHTTQDGVKVEETAVMETVQTVQEPAAKTTQAQPSTAPVTTQEQPVAQSTTEAKPQGTAADCGPLFATATENTENK
ncbi:RNA-binding cell elongation regulator Jag/EloR [Candidatus Avelusimicrobium luingense]|uniref:RNA-binding cell elongation regulator Jag/EloR n=1 Tax=Candidatus Avelusimicrobium luingense TaxID=3416211 RepID=UPI003D136EDE